MTTFVKRSYNGGARALKLTAPITPTATSFAATGNFVTWPTGATGPFVVTVTKGLSTEEKMTMGAFSHSTGIFSSITRGFDGTTAVGHVPQTTTVAAQIQLTWSAVEAQQANRVAHTVGTIQSQTATTVPLIHTTGGIKKFNYGNPGLQFGLNTTASNIKNPGPTASAGPGGTTLGAKAGHVHKFIAVTHTHVIQGSVPSTPQFFMQLAVKVVSANSSGIATMPLPQTFPNAFLGAFVINYASNNPFFLYLAPITCSTAHAAFNCYDKTGSRVTTETFGLVVLAVGC